MLEPVESAFIALLVSADGSIWLLPIPDIWAPRIAVPVSFPPLRHREFKRVTTDYGSLPVYEEVR
jgi:hypothetical protein